MMNIQWIEQQRNRPADTEPPENDVSGDPAPAGKEATPGLEELFKLMVRLV